MMIWSQLLAVVFYFACLFIIAMRQRNSATIGDYLTAGKNEGVWTTAFSERTTGESGWLLLGLTGLGFSLGAQSWWVVAGETICCAFSWIVLAPRFKRLSERMPDCLTMFDFFESATQDRSRTIRIVGTLIVLILVPMYLSAQFTAIGKAAKIFYGLDPVIGSIAGGILVCAYTSLGGFRAVARTDIVQGIFMLGGLLAALAGVTLAFGRQGFPWLEISGFWSVWGPNGLTIASACKCFSLFAIGFGFLGMPHLFVKFLAARDVSVIKKGVPIAIMFTLIADSSAVLIGMVGRQVFPQLADAEFIFPQIAQTYFPPFVSGLLFCSVLAATMSTADSLLLFLASSVVRDVYQQLLNNKTSSQAGLIRASQLIMVGATILGVWTSLGDSRLVFWMVLLAWSGLGAAFNPLLMMMVFNRPLTRTSAVAGIITGFTVAIGWYLFAGRMGIYEMIPGFLAGGLVMFLIGRTEAHEAIS
ncbi:MAG: sodium/proline symporter [Elusimicrobiota bacterium]|jgi:sodium/proline symporter